ncbi:ATP-binding protein [Kitasatospora sp. NPDC056731]|uniref:ATP-binding protein n=1 Tax=Kitasatospora sp. NPDC056731 TaxID=3155422 RepID=UPI00341BC420
MLRAYLAALPTGDRYRDTAELLLGELFANAVQHTDAPTDRPTGDHLRLEVHDAGNGRPSLRTPTPDTRLKPALTHCRNRARATTHP